MKIIRVIEYEADAKQLLEQMATSMSDGIHNKGKVKITIHTIGNSKLLSLLEVIKEVQIKLDKEQN